jgi:cytoskeletal protein RodZ
LSFWRQLAQERELRGVSLEEVAERTKIPRSTLERLESGTPEHLPARVYLVGYLRAYADAVGLDADDVVLRFEEAHPGGEDGEAREDGETGRPPEPRRAPLLFVSVTLVLLALAGVLWALFD